jgi:small-conductance mechanosensitive channel
MARRASPRARARRAHECLLAAAVALAALAPAANGQGAATNASRANGNAAAPANVNAAPAAPEAPPAPAAVPVPDVVARAEEVTTTLREIEADLASDRATSVVERELPELAREIDARLSETAPVLEARPSLDTLRDLESGWRTLTGRLPEWRRGLTSRATQLEDQLAQLGRLEETWSLTLEQARASEAPEAVSERAAATLAAIRRTRALAQRSREVVLTLQDRVSEQQQRVTDALERLSAAREATVNLLFARDSPPLWRADIRERSGGALAAQFRASIAEQLGAVREFAARNVDRIPIQVGLFLLAFALLRYSRGRVRKWAEAEPSLRPAAIIFALPVSTALVIAVFASGWLYAQIPRALSVILGAAVLFPTVRILRRLFERPLYPALNALVTFYVTDRVRELAQPLPPVARILFLVEMLGGVVFLLWVVRSARQAEGAPGRTPRAVLRVAGVAARVALVAFAVAAVANVLGYVSLSRLLGDGTLGSAYAAVVIYAAVRIVDGLVSFALRVRPLSLLGGVRRHRGLVGRRVRRLFRLLAAFLWVLATLDLFAVRAPLFDVVRRAFTAELAVGAVRISLTDVLAFGLTIWAAFLLSRFVRFILEEDVYPRVELGRGLPYAISTVLNYAILLFGFLLAIGATGVDMDRFTILASAFGVGLGFGLQNVVNNFVSGLILLFERPVKVGDVVNLGTLGGEVRRIGIRASVVRTWDRAEVIVPNGNFISEPVVNWTLTDRERGIEVVVGVAYGNDPGQVVALLTGVIHGHPKVLPEPEPHVLFEGFGDSALNFKVRGWTAEPDWVKVRSDLGIQVYAALRDAGIEIPFPQRDLHVRSVTIEQGSGVSGQGLGEGGQGTEAGDQETVDSRQSA